jgi:septum formation protein
MKFKYLTQLATQYGLVLGSRSPRRVRLLREIGIPFTQIVPDLEETREPGEEPYAFATRLAEDKAELVGRETNSSQVVIGSDTIVLLGDRLLGKPENADDAFEILWTLAGKKHVVCTALALYTRGKVIASGYELTDVYFNEVKPEQVWEYIATGEPMDKAGAYGIQAEGAFLVDRISGNLDNVIGLPRHLLEDLARRTLEQLKLSS